MPYRRRIAALTSSQSAERAMSIAAKACCAFPVNCGANMNAYRSFGTSYTTIMHSKVVRYASTRRPSLPASSASPLPLPSPPGTTDGCTLLPRVSSTSCRSSLTSSSCRLRSYASSSSGRHWSSASICTNSAKPACSVCILILNRHPDLVVIHRWLFDQLSNESTTAATICEGFTPETCVV